MAQVEMEYGGGSSIPFQYEEGEHETKSKWIDGKTIYMRVYKWSSISTNTVIDSTLNTSNVDTIIDMYGYVTQNNGNKTKIPYYYSSTDLASLLLESRGLVYGTIGGYSIGEGSLVVLFTKK